MIKLDLRKNENQLKKTNKILEKWNKMENNLNKWNKSEKKTIFTIEAPPKRQDTQLGSKKTCHNRAPSHYSCASINISEIVVFAQQNTEAWHFLPCESNGQSLQGIDSTSFFTSMVWREESSAWSIWE